jgi:hypothetical protein
MLCSECLCPSKTYAETVTPNVAGGAFGKWLGLKAVRGWSYCDGISAL